MSGQSRRNRYISRSWAVVFGCICAGSILITGSSVFADEEKPGEVESRGMPQLQKPMPPSMPVQPGAPAQQKFQLPTWPQQWQVNNREPAGFGFGVTQPGPVTVDVQGQGAPVVVSLLGAIPQPVQQQAGSGPLRLTYQVTPADVQRGVLWQVRIALAQPGGPPAQAAGTIAVQHPPADANVVRAQLQARMAQRRAGDPQAEAAMKAKMDVSFQSEITKLQQEQAARRTTLLRDVQSQPSAGGTVLSGQIKPRGLEGSDQAPEEPVPTSESDVSTRAVPPKVPGVTDRQNLLLQAIQANRPYVVGFSRWQAQPGDLVAVEGSKFSNSAAGGQVLVVLKGPAGVVPFVAPVKTWADTEIQINVPDNISGIANVTNADVVVVRGADGMRSDPSNDYGGYFRVQPAIELRQLALPPSWADSFVHFPDNNTLTGEGSVSNTMSEAPPGWCRSGSTWRVCLGMAGLFGDKGYDEFFMTKRLKNGWRVASADVTLFHPNGWGAYVVESRIGQDSPYIKVRSWAEPIKSNEYWVHIMIRGPKGVPHE